MRLIIITVIILINTIAANGTESQMNSSNIDSSTIRQNYNSFDTILQSFSTSDGKIDYTSIRNDPFNLNKFLNFIGTVSPRSHHDYFSEADAKAYWINVYNALAIKTIIDNPDVDSIREIAWGMGAFWRTKFVVGGEKLTLNNIEHKILRKQYKDPRIHFAINCASNSCPPIGNRIVTGENLSEQLDKKAFDFINNAANVRFDHRAKKVYLSRIFKWFKKDFTRNHTSLLEYILKYHSAKDLIEYDEISSYKIIYNQYDWSLND